MSVKLVLEKSGDGYDILKRKMLNKNRFPNQSRQVCQDTEKNVAGRAAGGGESRTVEQVDEDVSWLWYCGYLLVLCWPGYGEFSSATF
jgi:hypothetical protein